MNIFEEMLNGIKDLCGIRALKDFGCVDSTQIGRCQMSAGLSVCQKEGTLLLEIKQLRKTRFQKSSDTFYCNISPENYEIVCDELKRIIDALRSTEMVPIKGRWFSRIIYGMFGYRIVGDLGCLNMTDGYYKSTGLIAEKKERRILLWTRRSLKNYSTSCNLFPETAVSGILTTIESYYNEIRKQAVG